MRTSSAITWTRGPEPRTPFVSIIVSSKVGRSGQSQNNRWIDVARYIGASIFAHDPALNMHAQPVTCQYAGRRRI